MKSKNTEVLTAYTDPILKAEIVSLAKEKEISVSELVTSTMRNVIETNKKEESRKTKGY